MILGVLAAALVACGQADELDSEAGSGTPVRVERAERTTLVELERSLGRTEAIADPYVAADVGGRVQRVRVDVGDTVSAGDILAELDPDRYVSALASAEAEVSGLDLELTQLERDLERLEQVAEAGYVSDSEMEAARSELERTRERRRAAESDLNEAQRQLRETRLQAPFDGRIDERLVSEGDSLSAGEPAFRLVPESAARVRLPFPEAQAERLAPGMAVRLRQLDREGEWQEGELTRLRPSVDGGALVAVVEFVPPEGWPLGTLLEALVEVATREDAVQVPSASVVERPGRDVVYVVPGDDDYGDVEEREVRIGYRTVQKLEIVEGLEGGERVVVDGADFLSDGTAVRVREAD